MPRQWFDVGDDFEAAARLAVAEEADELRRMEADRATPPPYSPLLTSGPRDLVARMDEDPAVATRLALIREQAQAIESLHPELGARLEVIHRQVGVVEGLEREVRPGLIYEQTEVIEGLHCELAAQLELIEWQARVLDQFRTVVVLLRQSRVYRAMRALGRWEWLDRRISRALRA